MDKDEDIFMKSNIIKLQRDLLNKILNNLIAWAGELSAKGNLPDKADRVFLNDFIVKVKETKTGLNRENNA